MPKYKQFSSSSLPFFISYPKRNLEVFFLKNYAFLLKVLGKYMFMGLDLFQIIKYNHSLTSDHPCITVHKHIAQRVSNVHNKKYFAEYVTFKQDGTDRRFIGIHDKR